MIKLPEIPAKGPRRWRELAKAAVDYMHAITPVAGENISVSELPGGTQINGRTGADGIPVRTYFLRNGVIVTYVLLARSGPTIE